MVPTTIHNNRRLQRGCLEWLLQEIDKVSDKSPCCGSWLRVTGCVRPAQPRCVFKSCSNHHDAEEYESALLHTRTPLPRLHHHNDPNFVFLADLLTVLSLNRSSSAGPTLGTRITLTNTANPAATTFFKPDPIFSRSCYNLPSAYAGKLSKAKIEWNVKDSSSNHIICNQVNFYAKTGCTGSSTTQRISSEANPYVYTYAPTTVRCGALIIQ